MRWIRAVLLKVLIPTTFASQETCHDYVTTFFAEIQENAKWPNNFGDEFANGSSRTKKTILLRNYDSDKEKSIALIRGLFHLMSWCLVSTQRKPHLQIGSSLSFGSLGTPKVSCPKLATQNRCFFERTILPGYLLWNIFSYKFNIFSYSPRSFKQTQ